MGKQVEVDETELVALQQVAALMQTALNNPKARPLIQKAVKTVNPNASIPEIDAAEPILEEVNKTREDLAALRKEIADSRAKHDEEEKLSKFHNKWERDKSAARAEGYMDSAIEEIEKLAEEQGIPSFEAAAALYAKRNPVQVNQPSANPNAFSFFESPPENDDTMKKLMDSRGEDPGSMNKLINDALADVRGGRRRAA